MQAGFYRGLMSTAYIIYERGGVMKRKVLHALGPSNVHKLHQNVYTIPCYQTQHLNPTAISVANQPIYTAQTQLNNHHPPSQ